MGQNKYETKTEYLYSFVWMPKKYGCIVCK